jgi:hypothetical protein
MESQSTEPIPEDLSHLSFEQRIAIWADLMDACDQLLQAGLQRKVGPGGDIKAAYREWHTAQMKEHDEMMLHLMEEFDGRSRTHGR